MAKKHKRKDQPEEPLPGTAAQAQGQPEAGVEPPAEPPEQPDRLVTGAEALEEQQKNPELKDNSGHRGGA